MGGGTDVALETADAAVLRGRVADVAAMVDLSKRTMINIKQNIAVSLGLKAVFLVTTVIGLTGLWPAILADTGATVLVTMNAQRTNRLDRDASFRCSACPPGPFHFAGNLQRGEPFFTLSLTGLPQTVHGTVARPYRALRPS
jgi:hypothetical protein